MPTFPIEPVSPISGIDSFLTNLRLLTPACSKWLAYNCVDQEVEEITSSAFGIPFKVPRRQGILLFMYHKGCFRLGLARDATGVKREVSDEVLAINMGKKYEFEKDKEKLVATMVRLMHDHRYPVRNYIRCDL
jgi:hypothetical protein